MESLLESDVLAQLRAATAQAHRELEQQVDIPQVCQSREKYERLLVDFLGFFEPLEAVLQQVSGWKERGFDWGERAKAGMLREDLQALGFSADEIANLPRCADLPEPATIAEAFGCAYVLEGSTLGGRHIVSILAKSDMPAEARHYFSSYGEHVGLRWREFLAMLNGFDPREAEGMVRLAGQTFEKMGAWLRRPQ
jgi:heme oxygenase